MVEPSPEGLGVSEKGAFVFYDVSAFVLIYRHIEKKALWPFRRQNS